MCTRVLCLILCAFSAHAGLLTIEIAHRGEVLNGKSFGRTGAYEVIRGRARFAVDPALRQNASITDLAFAPRNSKGLVEFSADIYVLKPRDSARGNGAVLLEAPNRGGKGMLSTFHRARGSLDPATEAEFGDGLLFEEGYTLVWVGWQHDVPRRESSMRLFPPEAKGQSGLVRSEFTATPGMIRFSLGDSGHIPYPVDESKPIRITVRDGIYGERRELTHEQARIENTDVVLSQPSVPGSIYEAVYHSSNPAIAGLGLAALRDTIAFLRYGGNDAAPLGDQHLFLKRAIGFGTSQSAMVLKALLYRGFNEDERGRRVFDGILANVAGGRRSTFQRFVQPSRTGGPMRNDSFSTTDQFPYSDVELRNPATGASDGVLIQAAKRKVIPKIFYTNSAYEYWGSAGSLLHTTLDGKHDVILPSTTRIYFLAGGQHGPSAFPPRKDRSVFLANWNDYRWTLRALFGRLDAWIRGEQEPPASRIPTIASGTLVPVSRYAFPGLPEGPGLPQGRKPDHAHFVQHLDFGPNYLGKGIIAFQPPLAGIRFQTLVPQCDSDGNDLAGVKMPAVAVPLGAFTGWNLRGPSIGAAGELLGNTGSYLPFALSKADRERSGDPRPSIEERYAGEQDYLSKLQKAAEALRGEGFLLKRDLPQLLQAGQREWEWLHPASTISGR